MITRVSIENLVIVDRAEFEPGAGLTCITGETGAGKTLLATAIGLLFGSDANASHVGPYSDHTYVEGEFAVSDSFWADESVAVLSELRPDESNELVLGRKVDRNGRTRALAWGRTVAKSDLVAAGRLLVAIAGQHAQRRLLDSSYQRQLLDTSSDDRHHQLLVDMQAAWRTLQSTTVSYNQLIVEAESIAAREQEIHDALEHINSVGPSIDDENELKFKRDLVRNRTMLVEALDRSVGELSGDGRASGAADGVGRAYAALSGIVELDAQSAILAESLLAVQSQLTDVAGELRVRLEEVGTDATPLDELEDRLSAYDELKRRYGGTIEAVVAYREELQRQSQLLVDTDSALKAAKDVLAAADLRANTTARALSESRRLLATSMQIAVAQQLADLGMGDSKFDVAVDSCSLTELGFDRVTFTIAPNARVALQPIADVASGGELSRIALALLVATGATEAGTIFFDEIDAGIGGHTAHAIARQLERLAENVQVLCITHLAQVAAKANTSVVIEKTKGETSLRTLSGDDQVLAELCRMMGADAADPVAIEHAQNLRHGRFVRGSDTKAGVVDAKAAQLSL